METLLDKPDPLDVMFINRVPEWAAPIVQFLCLVLGFLLAFPFAWLGFVLVGKGIHTAVLVAVLVGYPAVFILGFTIFKARLVASLAAMFGKGIFKQLKKLLFRFILTRKSPLDDPAVVEELLEHLPDEERWANEPEHPMVKAFRKASNAYWHVALLLGTIALVAVWLGGGGLLGALNTCSAYIAYGVLLSILGRHGMVLLPMDEAW